MTAEPALVPGEVVALSARVRRIIAPNPGMMTGPGTNTYLVGDGDVAVIDPGPDDAGHLAAIAAAAGSGAIRWIICTHTHPDHAPGAAGLKERTGAEVLGFTSRDALTVDRELGDGDDVDLGSSVLQAVHTPGHASNHLCFWLATERLLFSGDHVMSGSTVVISPPDGDMDAYLASLARVRAMGPAAIAPGHGSLITDVDAYLATYIEHRVSRERQIVDTLARIGPADTAALVADIYTDVGTHLHPVAQRSVWAHLRKLAAERRVSSDDPDDPDSLWSTTD